MRNPTISIGMPAYNAERTIADAIESLLGQTHSDFELIVSDNASTDTTYEIIQRYARLDSRIVVLRQQENIGANGNFSSVFHHARAHCFKWASSSDWCAPTFLATCLDALTRNKNAVLAAPRTRLFESDPRDAHDYLDDIQILDSSPSKRLSRLVSTLRLNNAMSGLIRSSALRETRLVERYCGADLVLMGHLAMLGQILRVDEFLLYRRMEAETATTLQDDDAWRRHHYPTASANVLFQAFKREAGWLRIAATARIPIPERLRALKHVTRITYWNRRYLMADLREAVSYSLGTGGLP